MKKITFLTIATLLLMGCQPTKEVTPTSALSKEVNSCVDAEMKKIKALNTNPNLILNIDKDAIVKDCIAKNK